MKPKILYILPLLVTMIAMCNSTSQNNGAKLYAINVGKEAEVQLTGDSVLKAIQPGTEVIAFRMSAYEKDKKGIEIESNSASLTAAMRQVLANVTPGTKIYFESIKAKESKGDTLLLVPLAFTVK